MRPTFSQFWYMAEKHRELEKIADLKAYLYEHGYTNQLSFYALAKTPLDGVHRYARMELFLDQEPTHQLVRKLYDYFSKFEPTQTDSVYVITHGVLRELKRRE